VEVKVEAEAMRRMLVESARQPRSFPPHATAQMDAAFGIGERIVAHSRTFALKSQRHVCEREAV